MTEPVELGIQLVDDDAIDALNRQWLGRDGPTDVIAFGDETADPMPWPEGPPARLLGDVVISLETAVRQVEEHEVSLVEEIQRLVIHGVLHLLGYDDETSSDRCRMHRRQETILATLADRPHPR